MLLLSYKCDSQTDFSITRLHPPLPSRRRDEALSQSISISDSTHPIRLKPLDSIIAIWEVYQAIEHPV